MNEPFEKLLELDHKTQLCFRIPQPRKVWEWAEAERRIAKSETAKPGIYRTATAPYQKEPQESFTDPDVQTTVLYWGKRLGKTEIIQNLHGSKMDEDPCNILHLMPTLESIEKWSKQFLMPMIRSVESLLKKIMPSKSRDSGNTLRSKSFPGGTINGIGSNSPSGFRQVQAPVVTCDEIDAMENGPEGDPVYLAFGRAENYSNSVQVVSSTATKILFKKKEGQDRDERSSGSRIHDWWLKSDQRKWFVKCPDCKQRHVLDWENVHWPKKKLGDGIHEHLVEQAYYECPLCKAQWNDNKRLKAILDGEWRATAPFKGIRGYWLNGINTVFPPKKGYKTKLHQFAAEFLEAKKGGSASETVWKNTFLCVPIEAEAEKLEAKPLLERRESYTPQALPMDVVHVSAIVDVQGDRLEVQTVGAGIGEETWMIERVKLVGNPEQDQVWKDLTAHLSKSFHRVDGIELKVSRIAADMGHLPMRVRKWKKSCGLVNIYCVYGSSGKQINLVLPKYNKTYDSYSYSVNTRLAKDLIFSRLKLKDMGARYIHFGREQEGFDAAYFDELTAEEKRIRYLHGHPEYYYEKIRSRNEALDHLVYWLAIIDIPPTPNWKLIGQNLLKLQPSATPIDYKMKTPMEQSQMAAKPVAQEPRKSRIIGGRGTGGRGNGGMAGSSFGNLGTGSFNIGKKP